METSERTGDGKPAPAAATELCAAPRVSIDTPATVRIVPLILVLLGALCAPLGSAAANQHQPKPHCAVPKGWHLAAQDAQGVVIRRTIPAPEPIHSADVWRYCARPRTRAHGAGRFRLLVRTLGCCTESGADFSGPPDIVEGLTLSGAYIANDAVWSGRGCCGAAQIRTLNVLTGRVAATSQIIGPRAEPPPPDLHTLFLSSTGVVVWLWTVADAAGSYRTDELRFFVSRNGQAAVLDSASRGGLTDLQIYRCVAGCTPASPVVVRWAHGGTQRDAAIG